MLTQKQFDDLNNLSDLRKQVEIYSTLRTTGTITESDYQVEMRSIVRRIEEMEKEYREIEYKAQFDELMGNPLKHLDEIWGSIWKQ